MKKRNIGMMFLRYDANLWYLAGIRRQTPQTTDENSYGNYLCGAYIGAEDGLTLVAPRMGGGFFQIEASNKPWIDGVRIIDESEKPSNVLLEVIKQFHLDGKGISLDDRTWVQSELEFQIALHSSKFSLASEIISPMRMIKDQVDFVVVSIHWGLSFQPMVLEYQMEIAHQLIDSGADIIMGHGPHVLHAIELYRSKPIFYSLGHFVFHKPKEVSTLLEPMKRTFQDFGFRWRSDETAIGKVVLVGPKVARVEMIPAMIKNGDPVLCDNESATPVTDYLKVLSRFLGTSVSVKKGKVIAKKGLT